MVEVYGRAGYAMLQTSRQVFWHKEGDSLSALWGDDGITEDNIADIWHEAAGATEARRVAREAASATAAGCRMAWCSCSSATDSSSRSQPRAGGPQQRGSSNLVRDRHDLGLPVHFDDHDRPHHRSVVAVPARTFETDCPSAGPRPVCADRDHRQEQRGLASTDHIYRSSGLHSASLPTSAGGIAWIKKPSGSTPAWRQTYRRDQATRPGLRSSWHEEACGATSPILQIPIAD